MSNKSKVTNQGRLNVPASVLKSAKFSAGDRLFVVATNRHIALTRRQTRNSVGSVTVNSDGRVRLSSTALDAAKFRKKNFSVSNSGKTVNVA